MPDLLSTAFLFFLLCAAASGGFVVKTRLPERHRSKESFELVQLSINLLVTFTAIVLGLLTNSVKNGFEAAYYGARRLRRLAGPAGPLPARLRTRDRSNAGTDGVLHGRGDLHHLAGRTAAERGQDPRARPGSPLTGGAPRLGAVLDRVGSELRQLAAFRFAAPAPSDVVPGTLSGHGEKPVAGDRGGARVDDAALLLGPGSFGSSSCSPASASPRHPIR